MAVERVRATVDPANQEAAGGEAAGGGDPSTEQFRYSNLHDDQRVLRRTLVVLAVVAIAVAITVLTVAVPVTAPEFVVITVAGLAAAVIVVTYLFLTYRVETQSVAPDTHLVDPGLEEIRSEIAGITVTPAAAFAYARAIVSPRSVYSRISESVEPTTRSTIVRTTYVLDDPPAHPYVIPIHLQERGTLVHGLRVEDAGEGKLSTLSRPLSIAYAAAVTRAMVVRLDPCIFRDYVRAIEPRVIDLLARVNRVEGAKAASDIVEELTARRAAKKRHPKYLAGLDVLRVFLAELELNYPIAVRVAPASGGRFVVTRRVIPVAERLKPYAAIPEIARTTWADRVRQFLGVPPNTLFATLENAERSGSYHLEIRGPEHTYLGRQEIVGHAGNHLEYSMEPRRGQRHAHLYIRNGSNLRTASFLTRYFERMPSSLAPAWISALASLVISGVIAAGQLSDTDQTDVSELLLAFPIAIAAWSGFDQGRGSWGGGLSARAIVIATILLSLLAMALSSVGPAILASTSALQSWWTATLALLGVVAVVGWAAWMKHGLVHRYFLDRRRADSDVAKADA